jgi:hypothetical protein
VRGKFTSGAMGGPAGIEPPARAIAASLRGTAFQGQRFLSHVFLSHVFLSHVVLGHVFPSHVFPSHLLASTPVPSVAPLARRLMPVFGDLHV